MSQNGTAARVGIVCGSRSDFPVMEKAVELLTRLEVPCELRAISAHRAPDLLFRFVGGAEERGIRVFIAGAGGAAHLAGVVAAKTIRPVIGVPIPTQVAGGLDSLLSMVQMPRGVPVATVAVGGAENAALLAVEILAISDAALAARLTAYREAQTRSIEDDESNADLAGGNLPAPGKPPASAR
jgi:5-(carboxyamino)imidazole ribonucleotide mutase